jgi:hypothetical protein
MGAGLTSGLPGVSQEELTIWSGPYMVILIWGYPPPPPCSMARANSLKNLVPANLQYPPQGGSWSAEQCKTPQRRNDFMYRSH